MTGVTSGTGTANPSGAPAVLRKYALWKWHMKLKCYSLNAIQ